MEDTLRFCGLAVAALLLSRLVKKAEPTAASAVAWAAAVLLALASVSRLGEALSFLRETGAMFPELGDSAETLLRCTGILWVTHGTSQLCRDAGEETLAGQAELLGSVLSVTAMMPLMRAFLSLLTSFF